MNVQAPTSFEEIARWARENTLSIAEAERKFAQFLILSAISRNTRLRQSLVFKGGNALEFLHLPNRSTTDLDFSLTFTLDSPPDVLATLHRQFDNAFEIVSRQGQTLFRLQKFVQNPPGPNRTHPTLIGRVAYALPGQQLQRRRLESGQHGMQVIQVEVSLNEVICAVTTMELGSTGQTVQVATIEDIVAEKLRALLQQVTRNRYRAQDVLDIATIMMHRGEELDRSQIREFLLAKAAARNVAVVADSFLNPAVRERSQSNYQALELTTRRSFIPFETAWASVLELTQSLELPKG